MRVLARQVGGRWRNSEGAGALRHHHWETLTRRKPESHRSRGGGCSGEYVNKQHIQLHLYSETWISAGSVTLSSSLLSEHQFETRDNFPLISLGSNSTSNCGWKLLSFHSAFCQLPQPYPLSARLWSFSPRYSSHIQSISDDGWCVRRRHRRQRLPHDLRGPGGHRGEEAQQVGDQQQQVWTRICKKKKHLLWPFFSLYITWNNHNAIILLLIFLRCSPFISPGG